MSEELWAIKKPDGTYVMFEPPMPFLFRSEKITNAYIDQIRKLAKPGSFWSAARPVRVVLFEDPTP